MSIEASSVPPADTNRLLTVPNLISVVRLAMMPVFVLTLFTWHDRFAAACILAGLGISDGVDGYIARHFHQVSRFGQIVDPIADRVLLVVALTSVAIDHSVPWWIIGAAAVREIAVILNTLYWAEHGVRFPVVFIGKAYTFGFMVAIPWFMAAHTRVFWHGFAHVAAYVFALPSLVFGWIALGMYVRTGRRLRLASSDRIAQPHQAG